MTISRVAIRLRIFLVTFLILLATLITMYAFVRARTEREVTNSIARDLEVRLALVTDRVYVQGGPADGVDTWDALADTLGALSAARVTLIRADGVVIGDSSVPRERIPSIENHGHRPEVAAALLGKPATSQRYSTTVREAMLYHATPWKINGQIVGVVRVALPMTRLRDAVGRLTTNLSLGAAIAFIAAIVVAIAAAQVGSRAVRELTAIASRMRSGDLGARSAFRGTDEFAELGHTLNGLAENLSATLDQLRAEKDRLNRVLSSMHEGVVVLDANGHLVLFNSALQEMLYLGSSIQGKRAEEVFEHPEFLALLAAAVDGHSSSQELTFERPTTKVFLANVRRLPPKGALAVLVDITEQRHLETVRQEFVANASHELRTPIAAISSAVETLQGAAAGDPEAGAGFLSMIERNARRLTALVDDLLSLSLLESGRLDFSLESVNLRTAVESSLNNFVGAAGSKQTELVNLVPPDVRVQATVRGLEHVIGNLVDNAIKYCPAGSRVRVAVEQQPDVVVVTVTDNGPGIPEHHRERVFERFYRIDAGRSRSLGGTGLGLAIVKHWVEAMQGTISVVCPREGTQFRVALAPSKVDSVRPPGLEGPFPTEVEL